MKLQWTVASARKFRSNGSFMGKGDDRHDGDSDDDDSHHDDPHHDDPHHAAGSIVSAAAGSRAWGEAAGELRYLSINLQGYVAALPNQSLPPRGRVQWSPAQILALSALARVLARGEDDVGRATASLNAIDTIFRRGQVDRATATNEAAAHRRAEAALLAHYLAQRAIATDSLLRLQRIGDVAREPMRARPSHRPSLWQLFWDRTLTHIRARRPL
jgi:hypothetical protein